MLAAQRNHDIKTNRNTLVTTRLDLSSMVGTGVQTEFRMHSLKLNCDLSRLTADPQETSHGSTYFDEALHAF
jgi:hypothetical protein